MESTWPLVQLLSSFVQAGLLLGVAAYQNEVAESVYESSKKEPLGAPQGKGLEGREGPWQDMHGALVLSQPQGLQGLGQA